MSTAFTDLLATQGYLLADGATGTILFDMGLMSGDAPELWNTEEPAKIKALYKGSVDAGSDIFLTNSFGANASRLKLHGAEKRVHELSRVSAEIARDVADVAGRTVIVAGSTGPTGEIMEPVGTLSHALAVEMFHETADGLKTGGADIGWLETISAPEEYRAAAEGFALAGLPWCGTMSFDTAGRTMMGVTSADMVKIVNDLGEQAPLAFGANCGTGASDLLRTVLGFRAQGPEKPVIAKANAGIPKYVDGSILYDGTPDLMAEYAVMVRACGAQIIGGCCGTKPEHLRHMREALDTRPIGQAPSLEEIVDRLGAFSSAADGTEADQAPQRRSTRRRRRDSSSSASCCSS